MSDPCPIHVRVPRGATLKETNLTWRTCSATGITYHLRILHFAWLQGAQRMLKGISPCISPELLATLHRMGHGDEIVLADAHFPGHSIGPQVLRADGIAIQSLLDGILSLFELDSYAPPLVMMDAVTGDTLDPAVERDYMEVVRRHSPAAPLPLRLERHAFYDRARAAFAIVMTGELRKYGNLILKKGVTPVA